MKITLLLVTALAFLCIVDGKPHNDGKRAHQIKRAKEHEMSNRMGHGKHHRSEHTTSLHRPESESTSHKVDARKTALHKKTEVMHRRGESVLGSASPVHDIKKDLHLQHVTEHNIQKKQHDDKQKADVTRAHLITNRMPSGEAVPPHLLTNRTPQVSANLNSSVLTKAQNRNVTKDGIPMESERLIHVTPRPLKVHKANKPHHKPTLATGVKSSIPAVYARPASSKAKAHKPPKKYSPKKHGWKKSMRKEKGKDKAKKNEKREKRNKALHRAIVARNL